MEQRKERPILFSGAMVRAILDGRKTQTRRILKPQPMHPGFASRHTLATDDEGQDLYVGSAALASPIRCPYGKPGDRLWVRETFCQKWCDQRGYLDEYLYRATEPDVVHPDGQDKSPWRPSIHMPRAASRITLEITGVRVERLKNISDQDALAEGILPPGMEIIMGTPQDGFKKLWELINGPGSWDANPWVWVIEFKRVDAKDRS